MTPQPSGCSPHLDGPHCDQHHARASPPLDSTESNGDGLPAIQFDEFGRGNSPLLGVCRVPSRQTFLHGRLHQSVLGRSARERERERLPERLNVHIV